MLYILNYKNYNFIKFGDEVINILQLQVIELSDKDILLLYLLKEILHEKYLNSPKALTKVNRELQRFETRNLWYKFVLVSLSK